MFAAYFVLVVKPQNTERVLEVCLEEAAASVRDEPDCYRFDVMRDRKNPNRLCFLEIYKDADALERHYETPHFVKMWRIVEPLLETQGDPDQTNLDLLYSSDTSLKT